MVLDAVPSGAVQYPNWMVIEPESGNAEIVYLPTAPTGTTFSGIVRNISTSANSDSGATGIAHAANVEVVMSLTHRDWNELVAWIQGTNGSGYTNLRLGDETDSNVTIYAQNADASKPFMRYDAATNKWLISNDGTSTFDISAGGSGLTRGPGVDIVASAITLDVRSSGGLRNNQGTGSAQADVDPAIVARLDTANTWTAVQTVSAGNVNLSSDASAATDPVRYSQLQSYVPQGPVSGTSGEAITAGQGLYVKASDGKLYKTAGTADESTFKFVGIALTTVGAADLTVTYAPPGHTVTGLTGLTAGAYYFITDTAGTLGTTPGTRFARVALALSTTVLQVKDPKYVVRGTQSITSATTFVQTVGFRPARIEILACQTGGGAGGSVGDDGNRCIAFRLVGADNEALQRATDAWYVYNRGASSLRNAGTVSATSETGFTLSCSTYVADATIYWTAFSE